jgi:hypothetical protein
MALTLLKALAMNEEKILNEIKMILYIKLPLVLVTIWDKDEDLHQGLMGFMRSMFRMSKKIRLITKMSKIKI